MPYALKWKRPLNVWWTYDFIGARIGIYIIVNRGR